VPYEDHPNGYNKRMIIGNIVKDQQRLFWVLHLGGWLAWGLIGKYAYTRALIEGTAPNYLLYVMIISMIGMVITLFLRQIYRYLWNHPAWIQGLGFIAACAGGGYVWYHSRSYIYTGWFKEAKDMDAWAEKMGHAAEMAEKVSFTEVYLSSCLVLAAWSVLYFAIKYYQVFQDVQKSALKSAAMAHEAQLKMLRYQLNPHFLFNTLNAISTLVLEQQTEMANRMVTKLSSFLRYSLDNDPMQKITLEQELEALKLYLDIEKVRFEERLNLELDIGEEAASALIPSLLLQPLVENAIKYGIARSEEGGHLRIAARVFAGDLLLEISDDGPGVELVDGQIPDANGVGLRNTRERLVELYGTAHSFRLSETDPHGLTIRIRVPHETEN
jgi:two-component sensor histidine kinase